VRYVSMISLIFWGMGCNWSPSNARLYNAGNAHFLANQLPEAIFAYGRGLRLDPNDQELRANLDYARARVSYPFGDRGRPEEDSWPSWLYRPSAFAVLMATVVLYAMTCAFVTRWLMTRRRAHLVRASILLLAGMSCAFFWLRIKRQRMARPVPAGGHPRG
jgi:hypothetical protein